MRYALYAVPAADDPLSAAAAAWLGRDAFTGATAPLPAVEGLVAGTLADYLADPARYGFHATLKAPFTLADGHSEAELVRELSRFAAQSSPLVIPELVIRRLGRFFAFVPNEPVAALDRWAGEIVANFEPFRAPLSESDIARRRVSELTLEEEANLLRWGYPYVFDAFRFHMSLTGKVPRDDAPVVETALRERFAAFDGKPFRIDRLAIFAEPGRGEPFRVLEVARLG